MPNSIFGFKFEIKTRVVLESISYEQGDNINGFAFPHDRKCNPSEFSCSNTGKKGGLQQKRHEIEDCLEVQ